MLVGLQLLGCASVPLKLTALVPCVDPKFVPEIVTDVPITPEVGDKLVMVGPDEISLPRPPNCRPKGLAIIFVWRFR